MTIDIINGENYSYQVLGDDLFVFLQWQLARRQKHWMSSLKQMLQQYPHWEANLSDAVRTPAFSNDQSPRFHFPSEEEDKMAKYICR